MSQEFRGCDGAGLVDHDDFLVVNSSADEGAVTESPLQMQGCADHELEVFPNGSTRTRTSREETTATNRTFRS